MKQLLVLSGKGGTGKTTLVSSFIELGGFEAFADCDVDAPNLALVTKLKQEPITNDYYGMDKVRINKDKCVGCRKCYDLCRFDAIEEDGLQYKVNSYHCEGCGLCEYACPQDAIEYVKNVAGYTYVYDEDRYLSSACLKMGEGNSGLLVTKVKENLKESDAPIAIIDGAPGIGCPVIASISAVDEVIIVTEPSLSGLSDLKRIVKMVCNNKLNPYIVINKYDVNVDKCKDIEEYLKEEGLILIGKIPFEKTCHSYLKQGLSLVESKSVASNVIKDMHEKMLRKLKGE